MSETLYTLPVIKQISPYLSLRKIGSLDLIVIVHPEVRAAITVQGAHLIAWQASGEKPLLWLSEKSPFTAGKAIRGGVPVCWPWFGPAGEPAHGFARILPWSLTAHDENERNVLLTMTLNSSEQSKKLWPHDFTLLLRFRLGERCEIEMEAHGDFDATAAFHSYFAVNDIQQVSVSGLGNTFIDKVNQSTEGDLSGGKQTYPDRVDRIHTQPEDCSIIHDNSTGSTLEIHHHHHSDVVTWNPGPALSSSMADMPGEGYRHMVCVETARITTPMQSRPESPARLAVTFQRVKR
ncbi:MAG: Putative glucose-6-phosphate 1-epimerase [Candidatus Erwinia impunctatus]|nr:Putative glucose-6-phosphate 1-epimerase [Culicoides impunctatus]